MKKRGTGNYEETWYRKPWRNAVQESAQKCGKILGAETKANIQ